MDDLIIITKTSATESLAKCFKMKHLGKLSYCLGINLEYDELTKSLCLLQRQYIQSLLERYGLFEAKPSATPADVNIKLMKDDGLSKPVDPVHYQSMVGSLLYAAMATRPDIAQAVGAVSKFNSCPNEAHLTAVKRSCMAKETILSEIKPIPAAPTVIKEDNQGIIAVAKSPISHARTKHIDIKFHYVREALQDELVEIIYCPTELMAADVLTKPLTRNRFETLLLMGLKDLPSQK